jgi:DNA integrity scanning protein DisA with diadenylate cyclase activity
MHEGTLILGAIIAIFIFYAFGLQMLLWAIGATVIVILIAFLYPIFRDEGKIKPFPVTMKNLWRKYLAWERKFFDWIDRNF